MADDPKKISFPKPADFIALVKCPGCGAPRGAPCRWFYGIDEGAVHVEREQEWQLYHDERRKLAEWNAQRGTP